MTLSFYGNIKACVYHPPIALNHYCSAQRVALINKIN